MVEVIKAMRNIGRALPIILAGGVAAFVASPAWAQDAAPTSAPAANAGVSSAPPVAPDASASAAPVVPLGPPAPADGAQAAIRPDGCFVPPAKLAKDQVDSFLAQPESLFETYGSSVLSSSNRVRALAGSDRRALDPILGLIANASADQKSAIGSGLGRAAFACASVDPIYAADIQARVASLNSPELLTAFVTASNDIQVAATGAAGGAGAAAAGLSGGGIAGPGSAGLGGDDTVAALVDTYSITSGRTIFIDSDDDDSDNTSVSPSLN